MTLPPYDQIRLEDHGLHLDRLGEALRAAGAAYEHATAACYRSKEAVDIYRREVQRFENAVGGVHILATMIMRAQLESRLGDTRLAHWIAMRLPEWALRAVAWL